MVFVVMWLVGCFVVWVIACMFVLYVGYFLGGGGFIFWVMGIVILWLLAVLYGIFGFIRFLSLLCFSWV